MREKLEKLINQYGMQKLLTELICLMDDRNQEHNEQYLTQLVKDLQNTYINYTNRYDDEPEDIQEPNQ